jgi:hypothetical protein
MSLGAILQYRNATPHIARGSQELLQSFQRGKPGPTTVLFGPLKQHLKGRRFNNNEEVEITVPEWLLMQKRVLKSNRYFTSCPDGKSASLCSGVMSEGSDTLLPRFSIFF